MKNLANATADEREIVKVRALYRIADSLEKVVARLEEGTLSIRTHHPLCMVPPNRDLTVADIEAVGKFVDAAITAGTLVLPSKAGGGS